MLDSKLKKMCKKFCEVVGGCLIGGAFISLIKTTVYDSGYFIRFFIGLSLGVVLLLIRKFYLSSHGSAKLEQNKEVK